MGIAKYENQCYWPESGGPHKEGFVVPLLFPCGPYTANNATTCCFKDDLCMEDGICRRPYHKITDALAFYVSGCTDIEHSDPACPKYDHCGNDAGSYVKYIGNYTWQCCFGQDPDKPNPCADPSGSKFSGPPIDKLVATARIDNSAVPHPLGKAKIPSAAPSHSGLQGGVIAGIVIGSIFVFLLFLTALAFCRRASKKRRWPFFPKSNYQETVRTDFTDKWVNEIGDSTDASSEPKKSMEVITRDVEK